MINTTASADPKVAGVPVHRVRGGEMVPDEDRLAVEEPLEIRLAYEAAGVFRRTSLVVTMRTPGHDAELAVGFLVSEGMVRHRDDVDDVSHCPAPEPRASHNVLTVRLRPGVGFDAKRLKRHFYTTSSCGVCGKTSIEALEVAGSPPLPAGQPRIDAAVVHGLPGALRAAQAVFAQTGGLHAAALFAPDGRLAGVREDVGRHNAVDKLVGAFLLDGRLPLNQQMLFVSGRASFELVQKALMAGCPVLAAVGAPSSLAVGLAESFGMTLIGFVRNDRFNVYTGVERVDQAQTDTL